VNKQITQLKDTLEKLYRKYNQHRLIKPDPFQFVHRYSEPADMEIVAFLASALAYGRVKQIEKSSNNLLARMGDSPFEFIRDFDEQKRTKLKDFRHRFTSGDCLSDLLSLLKKVLYQYGSIERFFAQGYNRRDRNIIPALSKFCDSLTHMHVAEHNGEPNRGLRFLLANPRRGSACKRLNLFLRWMVRDDDVDTGLWKSVDKAKLVVPVDVHMARLSGILGFHSRKTVSLATAVQITEAFAEIEPADPVKYDFALSRIGIVGNCTGHYRSECELCELFEYCSRREDWAK